MGISRIFFVFVFFTSPFISTGRFDDVILGLFFFMFFYCSTRSVWIQSSDDEEENSLFFFFFSYLHSICFVSVPVLPTAVVKITKEKKKTNNKIKPQQKHQQPNKQENKKKS